MLSTLQESRSGGLLRKLLQWLEESTRLSTHLIRNHIIVINADKVAVTGNKDKDKMYHHHTGFPGGLKSVNFNTLIGKKPTEPLYIAVKGMLPKGPLGRKLLKNVKIYAGSEHPHAAQNPVAVAL